MTYRICYQVTRALLWILFTALGGIRVEGRRHLPRRGAAILAANHLSNADPPAIAVASARGPYFMAKEELFKIRFLGPLIRLLHAFPVKRGSGDRAALRRAEQLLSQGELVVIFPEGRESETGELIAFQPGAALLSLRAGVPVIPICLKGTDGVMPYGTVIPRRSPRPTVVRIGPPVCLDDLRDHPDRRQALMEGAERIRAAVAALADG
ncbi:MAG TPA: lysophospholipid acyltransferase family protein [Armatimonadota bacterium]|nr:lysophospholipid acyltransferase family protein [Armatimonadota bacterium]HPO74446.1 lysophospholipid acyltransferase family protein [Armatimonadota bacterium]HPT96792.1 lysophospholipid acyltransferase family protein [Armatimonadota bacterium]